MKGRTYTKAFLVWLIIIAAETIHGIIRTVFIAPAIGDMPSRQIGILVGSVLIFIIALLTINWLETGSIGTRLMIGAGWVVLTISFEILLGFFVLGVGRERVISDYDIQNGGYMLFGLLWMLASPALAHAVRNKG